MAILMKFFQKKKKEVTFWGWIDFLDQALSMYGFNSIESRLEKKKQERAAKQKKEKKVGIIMFSNCRWAGYLERWVVLWAVGGSVFVKKRVSRFLHFGENNAFFRYALCFIKEWPDMAIVALSSFWNWVWIGIRGFTCSCKRTWCCLHILLCGSENIHFHHSNLLQWSLWRCVRDSSISSWRTLF